MTKHLDYIRYLNSKTLVLVDAYDPSAWGNVKGDLADFTDLVTEAGNSDDEGIVNWLSISWVWIENESVGAVAYSII